MRPLVLDVETETYNKGNPFDPRNKLVCWSYWYEKNYNAFLWPDNADSLIKSIDQADVIVGFNFKFDYHWLYNHQVRFDGKRIWDCQIAHYILRNQTTVYPSLNDVLAYYGLSPKLDVVKTEYWDKGITTSLIPWEILKEYAAGDAQSTWEVFTRQWEEATDKQKTLIFQYGQDLYVMCEMERNGLTYDVNLVKEREQQVDDKIREIKERLESIYPSVPINFNSNDHVSSFLYGGTIEEVKKVHDGFYKTGLKAGQPKLKNITVEHTLPALYKPVHGSELKKAGYYATNEPTLRSLKGDPKIIGLLLELAKYEKLNNTYYKGIPKINMEMNWAPGVLHGNYNTTQTATGRLSSSKPNQQNMAGDILDIFVSKFND